MIYYIFPFIVKKTLYSNGFISGDVDGSHEAVPVSIKIFMFLTDGSNCNQDFGNAALAVGTQMAIKIFEMGR